MKTDRLEIEAFLDTLTPEDWTAAVYRMVLDSRADWKTEARYWRGAAIALGVGLGLFAAAGWLAAGLGLWAEVGP